MEINSEVEVESMEESEKLGKPDKFLSDFYKLR